jgi:2-phosphoglycerate kinase
MLYLVSGASRSGKTLIAKQIMKRTSIPYMSLDWLVMGFTNGVPEYGIHDKLWPNEIAEKIWPFLNAMCASMLWSEVDYILEGEAVLPGLISDLLIKHPNKIRVCFLGYTDVNAEDKVKEVKLYSGGKGDWLTTEPDEFINNHIENMIVYSNLIKNECADHSLAYVDTSSDFEESIENAIELLLA